MGAAAAAVPPAAAPAPAGRLPAQCPQCGGPIHPDEVEWVQDAAGAGQPAAECPYCGNPLYPNKAASGRAVSLAGMHTFYSDKHNLHNTDGVRLEGHPFVTDEVPARAQVLLEAVRAANLGPVVEPQDFGLGPIQAVHDAGFLQHLQEIYSESARVTGRAEPVFVSTFSPRSAQRRARGVYGETGYYAYGVGSPILEGTWEGGVLERPMRPGGRRPRARG